MRSRKSWHGIAAGYRSIAGGRTSESWLWAAGDMVRGPDVVTAVADGHRVAASIHAVLIPVEKTT